MPLPGSSHVHSAATPKRADGFRTTSPQDRPRLHTRRRPRVTSYSFSEPSEPMRSTASQLAPIRQSRLQKQFPKLKVSTMGRSRARSATSRFMVCGTWTCRVRSPTSAAVPPPSLSTATARGPEPLHSTPQVTQSHYPSRVAQSVTALCVAEGAVPRRRPRALQDHRTATPEGASSRPSAGQSDDDEQPCGASLPYVGFHDDRQKDPGSLRFLSETCPNAAEERSGPRNKGGAAAPSRPRNIETPVFVGPGLITDCRASRTQR